MLNEQGQISMIHLMIAFRYFNYKAIKGTHSKGNIFKLFAAKSERKIGLSSILNHRGRYYQTSGILNEEKQLKKNSQLFFHTNCLNQNLLLQSIQIQFDNYGFRIVGNYCLI
ncbi:unnamed protein product [Paramecium octaurelia]|uniref:Uncharacterized protein n=1 Tax=Paramecium octaurelia TaxID=43137 RepID=A0A8S1WTZ8_PAROT|nr:unnamed protein product [Paramecium octaurelia]